MSKSIAAEISKGFSKAFVADVAISLGVKTVTRMAPSTIPVIGPVASAGIAGYYVYQIGKPIVKRILSKNTKEEIVEAPFGDDATLVN